MPEIFDNINAHLRTALHAVLSNVRRLDAPSATSTFVVGIVSPPSFHRSLVLMLAAADSLWACYPPDAVMCAAQRV